MDSEEFNDLVNEILKVIPARTNRIYLAQVLRLWVEAGGEAAEKALRDYAASKRSAAGAGRM